MTRKTRRDLVHSPTSSQALRLRRDISGWALICTLAKFRLPGEGPESTGSVRASHIPAVLPTEVWALEADEERFKFTAQHQLQTAKSPAGFETRANGGAEKAGGSGCSGPQRPCPVRMAQHLPAAHARLPYDTLHMAPCVNAPRSPAAVPIPESAPERGNRGPHPELQRCSQTLAGEEATVPLPATTSLSFIPRAFASIYTK